MPVGHLLTLRLEGGRALAPTRSHRLALARRAARVALPFELLAWRAEGDRARFVVLGPPEATLACAHRLLLAIQVQPGAVAAAPPDLWPLADAPTLAAVVRAVLRPEAIDDPRHEASALPELLGLRVDPAGLRERLRLRLPRLADSELAALLGRRPWALPPGDPAQLAEAAAAAVGEESLGGIAAHVVRARAAAVQVALPRLGPEHVGAALGLPPRAVLRLQGLPVPASLRQAVDGQWRLCTALAAGASPFRRPPSVQALVQ